MDIIILISFALLHERYTILETLDERRKVECTLGDHRFHTGLVCDSEMVQNLTI